MAVVTRRKKSALVVLYVAAAASVALAQARLHHQYAAVVMTWRRSWGGGGKENIVIMRQLHAAPLVIFYVHALRNVGNNRLISMFCGGGKCGDKREASSARRAKRPYLAVMAKYQHIYAAALAAS